MADPKPPPPPSPGAQPALPEAHALAQGLGVLVYNTMNRHWFSATDERETLVAFFALTAGCLTRNSELVFKLAGEDLTVNGVPPREVERYVGTLIAQMRALDAGNFALRRGMTVEDMQRLVHLLAAEPEDLQPQGGFAGALSSQGVGHVTAKTIVYRELAEDDVVISRTAVAAAATAAGAATAGTEPAVNADQALQHLQASPGQAASLEAMQAVRELAADTKRLATLVLQAARSREESQRSLADGLMRSLQRTFEAWMKSSDARTQSGKKRIQKNLRSLEQEVLSLLEGQPADIQEGCRRALADTVAGMADDLRVDSLAAEYLKRLKSIEQSEQRLRRYLKARDHTGGGMDPALEARLTEGGLPPERLWALVGNTPASTPEKLGALLTNLQQAGAALGSAGAPPAGDGSGGATGQTAAPAAGLDDMLKEVRQEIARLVERTADKIRKVTVDLQADDAAAPETDPAAAAARKLSRRKLLEMLAEVVQELCQPLSVVQCSVDMLKSNMLGELSRAQTDLLGLVAESTAKLQHLIDGLRSIAGVPKALQPDRALLDSLKQP